MIDDRDRQREHDVDQNLGIGMTITARIAHQAQGQREIRVFHETFKKVFMLTYPSCS